MKKNITIFIVALFVFLSGNITRVFAATLYFDPEDRTVGTKTSFSIALLIDAETPVNAISVSLPIPEGFEPIDVSTGNSILNYWIERPHYDASKRELTFSGLVPGGFKGEGARLVILSLKASKLGLFTFDYGKETLIKKNTERGDPEEIKTLPLSIRVQEGRDNLENPIPDKESPEFFTPVIGEISSQGERMVFFETEDKGSGMAYFEVAESKRKPKNYATLSFVKAESPYLLSDQELTSYIYIKAVDKDGNERVATLPPLHPMTWRELHARDILIMLFVLLLLLFFWKSRIKKSHVL